MTMVPIVLTVAGCVVAIVGVIVAAIEVLAWVSAEIDPDFIPED
jgi:hypothetical protein